MKISGDEYVGLDCREMDKVRSVIEKNRKRKLSKHKKLANNTVIEIDINTLKENISEICEALDLHATPQTSTKSSKSKQNNIIFVLTKITTPCATTLE
jgi:hypothetical protein